MTVQETPRQVAERRLKEARLKATPLNKRDALSVGMNGRLQQRAGDTETFDQAIERRVIKGYAVIWNKPNQHSEIFLKGAFSRSIRENGPGSGANYEIKFMSRHREELTLFASIIEDDIGLWFETKPLDTDEESERVLMRVKSGALNNYSVGFDYLWDQPNSMEWSDALGAILIREAKLFEISIVPLPSDMNTYTIRSQEDKEEDTLTLDNDILGFINSLPQGRKLQARELFARQKSFYQMPQKDQAEAQGVDSRNVTGDEIDYNYLINNL